MNYAKAAKVARAIAGLSQKEVADLAGLDPSHVSLIEGGRRNPSLATVEKMARALQIPTHLFTLLAAEPADLNITDPAELARVSQSLTQLLVRHVDRPRSSHAKSAKRQRQ